MKITKISFREKETINVEGTTMDVEITMDKLAKDIIHRIFGYDETYFFNARCIISPEVVQKQLRDKEYAIIYYHNQNGCEIMDKYSVVTNKMRETTCVSFEYVADSIEYIDFDTISKAVEQRLVETAIALQA